MENRLAFAKGQDSGWGPDYKRKTWQFNKKEEYLGMLMGEYPALPSCHNS